MSTNSLFQCFFDSSVATTPARPTRRLNRASSADQPNSSSTKSPKLLRNSAGKKRERVVVPGGGSKCPKSSNDGAQSRLIYTLAEQMTSELDSVFRHLGIDFPSLPLEIVRFLPLYSWTKDPEKLRTEVSHLGTIVDNAQYTFGAVLGSKLSPNVDHIVSIQLVEGVEFGVGVCSLENVKLATNRDFMCEKGGWGYYNWQPKRKGIKPKYPAGFYEQTQKCQYRQPQKDIFQCGDVLTMVIAREMAFPKSKRVEYPSADGMWTLRYFKNGVPMAFEFKHIPGPIHLCLNYYFMKTKLKILSDFRLSRKYLRVRREM